MDYNEYRLREIREMLELIGDRDDVQKEELLLERKCILHELRHTESLPHGIE